MGPSGAVTVVSVRQMRFLAAVVSVLVVGALITALNIYELHRLTRQQQFRAYDPGEIGVAEARGPNHYWRPVAWIRGKNKGTGYLTHITNVFLRLGFDLAGDSGDNGQWDVLWSHNYPFKEMKLTMTNLRPQQRVNHFPGSGFITNKVNLAVSGLPYIPKAFRMPAEKTQLLAHAKNNPEMMFVQKSNNHRGIKIEKLDDLDLGADGSFVQEFVHNPLLVDGYKFDIGVYAVVTSIQPLRVYVFDGDVLFRFCPSKYHPFDPAQRDKYVVGDDYLPTWKVPSLSHYYKDLGFGMKGSFDAWLRTQEKDASVVWDAVKDAIRTVLYAKEAALIQAASHYKRSSNFFEMMRFDFVIDDQLSVHLMEANMSPNLSTAHFKENRLLYEQVVYNLLTLVGVGRPVQHKGGSDNLAAPPTKEEQEMQCAAKDIVVFPDHCLVNCGELSGESGMDTEKNLIVTCSKVECQLCLPCLTQEQQTDLCQAYLEHQWRGACRRVVPQTLGSQDDAHQAADMTGLTADNTLLTEWFRGKCLADPAFCS